MKTTVELPAQLVAEAKRLAREEGSTLRELIAAGLQQQVDARRGGGEREPLRRHTFRGDGVRDEFVGSDFARIREAAYEGRGA